ncbi:nicotinamidase-related amidase [Scopulibacillus darangshiensis]|uniref:Nicotinamidase-related amidase n=1 Tax=Scopulibacillus darangshiensis TaxID=442528 RepID=A0A4R2NGF0_9BACL|nr:isochorismatase family cysteine hydrolase [Scopulibacillus darangshiensis]TCP20292.1 nicotinamidase-related amidase [Scopulibacillus darangshiensis]
MKNKHHAGAKHPVALLLIDMINNMEFKEAELLLKEARAIIDPLVDLRGRAKKANIPVIYVNDNYGIWQSDLNQVVDKAMEGPGRWIIEKLKPDKDDYFVVKPKHSGFFSTPLDTLLNHLGVNTLIITGMAGNICVLFTANDAYMRNYTVIVPSDCCASNVREDNDYALRMMKNNLDADIREQGKIDLSQLGV